MLVNVKNGTATRGELSRFNTENVTAVLCPIERLLEHFKPDELAVVTSYQAQVWLYQLALCIMRLE